MKSPCIKNGVRFFCVLLAVSLCLPLCFSATATAAADETPCPADWQLKNGELVGIGAVFDPIPLPVGYRIAPISYYMYECVITDGGVRYAVQRPLENTDLVWLSPLSGGETRLFATAAGAEAVQNMLSGKEGVYSLHTGVSSHDEPDQSITVTENWIEGLSVGGLVQSTEVLLLSELERYDIRFSDTTGSIYTAAGAFYEYEGGLLYVDYRTLGNQYFDADGNFSYRSGAVDAVLLTVDALASVWSQLARAEQTKGTILYERQTYEQEGEIRDGQETVPIFWIFYVINGFLLPTVLLICGLVMANSRRRKKTRRWYVLAGLAGVWMLSAALLAVFLTH